MAYPAGRAYTVGQVSRLAGVTVRTLHHYDEIGLLSPSEREPSGYRRYDEADLERLAQIRYYRELGFSLEEISSILADPAADPVVHLRRQHELLTARIARLREMLLAVERAMEAKKVDIPLSAEERFEVFGRFDPDQHEPEVRKRWGGTDAYRESARRVGGYGPDDWRRMKAESDDWVRRLAAAMDAGVPAESQTARVLAEEHRAHIGKWFYDCSYEIHVGLADMYVADPRFTANYEAIRPGLAQYLRDAIHANAIDRA